jgi:hypothetical protein
MTPSNVPPVVTVSDFRILRAAFKNPERYPDALIQHYLTQAAAMMNWPVWLDMYVEGVLDRTAHYVTIAKRNEQADERGGVSGNAIGRLTAKSVGGVSVSYDVSATAEPDAGHWNTTTYGSTFIRNVRIAGTGGIQLGGDPCAIPANNGPAWPGPPQSEFLPSSAF